VKSFLVKGVIAILFFILGFVANEFFFASSSVSKKSDYLSNISSSINIADSKQNALTNDFAQQIIQCINDDKIHSITELYATQDDLLNILQQIGISGDDKIDLEEKIRKNFTRSEDRIIKCEQAWNTIRDEMQQNGLQIGNLRVIGLNYESEQMFHFILFKKFNIIFEQNNKTYQIKLEDVWQFNDIIRLSNSKIKWSKFEIESKKEFQRIL